MAVVSIGTRQANFRSRLPLTFPTRKLDAGKSYLFFLRTSPIGEAIQNGYFVVIPIFEAAGELLEMPMVAKYFPKGRTMAFYIDVIEPDKLKKVDMAVMLLPKEFYRGTASPAAIEIELLWENKSTFKPLRE